MTRGQYRELLAAVKAAADAEQSVYISPPIRKVVESYNLSEDELKFILQDLGYFMDGEGSYFESLTDSEDFYPLNNLFHVVLDLLEHLPSGEILRILEDAI